MTRAEKRKSYREMRRRHSKALRAYRRKNPELLGVDVGELAIETGGIGVGGILAGNVAGYLSDKLAGMNRGVKGLLFVTAGGAMVVAGKYGQDRLEDLPVYPFSCAVAALSVVEGFKAWGLVKNGQQVTIEVEGGEGEGATGTVEGNIVHLSEGQFRQLAGGLIRTTGASVEARQIAGGIIETERAAPTGAMPRVARSQMYLPRMRSRQVI